MVIYNKKTKYNLYLSDSLDLGEDEMKYYGGNDEIALKIFELNSSIDNVIENIKNYYREYSTNSKLKSEIEVLEYWKHSDKENLFENFNTKYINLLSLEMEETLKNRTNAYIKHIKLMESKEDCLYKYEKLSNLIMQIPEKINYFIECELSTDNTEIKQQVKQNSTIKPENKKTSPYDEMSFSYGYEWTIYDLAA